ncbi:hypothetical protein [Peredibacter starrii]|uniref:Uncharacterized protein n=1 Tax=Peredibacter starrii TaxID=28202 RepID=A0AAX4HQS3_9BACT|nr:hypothetical protein [Peredibacter starrii]WPU65706.1 hypothetical protein SOO65_03005 [Peredibacter starrii]
MKFLLIGAMSLFVMSAMAEDLNAMKKTANEQIDSKISLLQKSKTCVNEATTVEKVKTCKSDLKDDMGMKQKMEETKDKMDDAL